MNLYFTSKAVSSSLRENYITSGQTCLLALPCIHLFSIDLNLMTTKQTAIFQTAIGKVMQIYQRYYMSRFPLHPIMRGKNLKTGYM